MQGARLLNWLIIIIGSVMIVRQGVAIWRIWKAGDKLKIAQAELVEAQDEQEQLKKKLAEVQTPEFVEQEARNKLGFAREGEIILILPDQANPKSQIPNPNVEEKLANWKKWKELYFE